MDNVPLEHRQWWNVFFFPLQAGEEAGGEKILEVNVWYLKLCRLGSGGLSRRFGCGLARLRLETERTDRGEKQQQKGLEGVLYCCFLKTFFNHFQTNTNTWRRTHEGVRECDNCGADVQFQRRQVTQAPHSSVKGVTAVWQRLFLRVSMATDNSRSLQDGYTQLASWFRTQEPVRVGQK